MSISSCPRCSQQVTLPIGLANDAQVRCPLCRSIYSLADALVKMPPLLEVVDEESDESSSEWLEMPAARTPVTPLSFDDPGANDDLRFDAAESEHDDLSTADSDTEIEELAFVSAPLDASEPHDSKSDPMDTLEFDGPLGDIPLASSADDEVNIDFDEIELQDATNASTAADDMALDFGDAPADDNLDSELPLEFDLEETAGESRPAVPPHFNQVAASAPPDDDDAIGLDFGDAIVEAPMTAPSDEDPASAKKKKKEKKPKKEKAAKLSKDVAGDGSPRKRSLVGTILGIALPAVIAVPLALYIAIWISPELDMLGYGRWLPGILLPPGVKNANKPPVAQAPSRPNLTLSQLAEMIPEEMRQGRGLPGAAPGAAEQTTAADGTAAVGDASAAPSGEAPPADAASSAPATTLPAGTAPAGTAPSTRTDNAPAELATPSLTAPEQPPAGDVANTDTPSAPSTPAATPEGNTPGTGDAAASANSLPTEPKSTGAAAEDDLDAVLGTKSDEPAEEMPAEDSDSIAEPSAEPSLVDAPAAEDAEAMPEESAEEVGPRNPPEYSADELTKAVKSATQATAKLNAAGASQDENAAKKNRKDFFLSLYGLANTITYATDEAGAELDAEQKQQAGQMIKTFAADPKQLEALKRYAAQWIAFPKRTTPGIVLAGTVQQIEQVGKLYQAKVKVGSTPTAPVVTLLSSEQLDVSPDDEILAFGSIIEQPADEVAGYEGDATSVVWSGVTQKLP